MNSLHGPLGSNLTKGPFMIYKAFLSLQCKQDLDAVDWVPRERERAAGLET